MPVYGSGVLLPLGLLLGATRPPPAGAPAAVRAWGRWAPGAPASPPEHGTVVASLNGSGALLGAGDRHSVGAAAGQVISLGANTYEQLGAASSFPAPTHSARAPGATPVPGATRAADSLDVVGAAGAPHCFAGSTHDAACEAIGMNGCLDGGCIPLSNTTAGAQLGALAAAQIAAGHAHTLMRTQNGEVWGWGRNLEGQLGLRAAAAPTLSPQRLPLGLAAQRGSAMGLAASVGAGHFKSAVVVGGRLELRVSSEGKNDVWTGGGTAPAHFGLRISLEVAGQEVFPGQAMRGHVVVVIDEHDGSVISEEQYNTHDAGESAANEMVDDVAALPAGRIVVVATAESGHRHIGVVSNALRSLGAEGALDAGEYGSWALVGRAGWRGEQWVQGGLSAPGAGPTTLEVSVPLAGFPGPSEVWACGMNAHGELGRGHKEEVPTDRGFVQATELSGLGVVAVAFGRDHSVVLTGSGSVYGLGSNIEGQLGAGAGLCIDDRACETLVPLEAENLPSVVAIAAGDHHSLALTAAGDVYCTGLNAHGECGLGHRELVDEFTQVPGLSSVQAIAAGSRHSLALTTAGSAFGFGYNYNGQIKGPSGSASGQCSAADDGQWQCPDEHFVLAPHEMAVADGEAVTGVAAGETFSVASV